MVQNVYFLNQWCTKGYMWVLLGSGLQWALPHGSENLSQAAQPAYFWIDFIQYEHPQPAPSVQPLLEAHPQFMLYLPVCHQHVLHLSCILHIKQSNCWENFSHWRKIQRKRVPLDRHLSYCHPSLNLLYVVPAGTEESYRESIATWLALFLPCILICSSLLWEENQVQQFDLGQLAPQADT